jgi:protein-L-isoaspartate(D-aspartate) O-methyltransferase
MGANMKSQRSLIFGILIGSASVIVFTVWQMQNALSQNGPRANAPGAQETSEQREQGVYDSGDEENQQQWAVQARRQMVERQLAARDVDDKQVLEAMRKVPRHRFVPENMQRQAYQDRPLPIGHDQTISQPYIVGLMTQLARPDESDIALDVGTGSGYQAAVVSELCKEVYSIEIVEPLAKEARERLKELDYENVTVRHGDGYQGWPEKAPFDLIIVAAAPDHIPEPLIEQLKPGGRLVIPVGNFFQRLMLVEKKPDGTIDKRKVAPVAFVPMTGDHQRD